MYTLSSKLRENPQKRDKKEMKTSRPMLGK
jgi:hypothetical protein